MNSEYSCRRIYLHAHKSAVKNDIHNLASRNNFPDKAMNEIDLIAAELASNHIKHDTINGRIKYGVFTDEKSGTYLEIISEDEGPGIPDYELALEDGYTTSSRSMGVGLGSVRRLSDEFSIKSSVSGTTIAIKKYAEKIPVIPEKKLMISVLTRPHPLENVCGDGYYIERFKNGACIAVIDGLGHGIHAREASACAEEYLRNNASKTSIKLLIDGLGEKLKKTRGAVASIMFINDDRGFMEFGGVGDISVHLYPKEDHISFQSVPGILGMKRREVKVQSYPWVSGRNMAVIHSDGISAKINLDDCMPEEKPDIIAHYIMNKYWRKNDDGTVMVVK
ncbi:ATP-binding protein [Methanoplanus endosymbiosus]|uniref:ATP-binding protein n=1 Tax=Methanoplanus endosymbiosus TaxID=33865 RepID=A0A9E7TL18_9EURY|nr:ATP-binding protein [Methanoplanus endosymbiosus]UUX93344.1 ATP-binding protein [Methanoplanus endosymbiosus]